MILVRKRGAQLVSIPNRDNPVNPVNEVNPVNSADCSHDWVD